MDTNSKRINNGKVTIKRFLNYELPVPIPDITQMGVKHTISKLGVKDS